MAEDKAFILRHRGVLFASGEDFRSFLQGVTTNDVEKVSAERAIWSALLTPQGKFLHEFFIAEIDGGFLIDGEADRLSDLLRRLKLYRLRAKVTLEDRSETFAVVAANGAGAAARLGLAPEAGRAGPFAGGIAFVDPRRPELGARAILPRDRLDALAAAGFAEGDLEAYDEQRIALAVPDGSRDMAVEGTILLENGFEELGGVDFTKGCFIGQEVTARTKYRGLLKKRLVPVTVEGEMPELGSPVLQEGKEVGRVCSTARGKALVLLRLTALGQALTTGAGATLDPALPPWLDARIERPQ